MSSPLVAIWRDVRTGRDDKKLQRILVASSGSRNISRTCNAAVGKESLPLFLTAISFFSLCNVAILGRLRHFLYSFLRSRSAMTSIVS